MRVQEKSNEIVEFYRKTTRGSIQPMSPFKPHNVETIAEREVISYIKKMSDGDDSILLVDSRTPAWIKLSGLIPGAINIPFTKFKESADALEVMEDQLDVLVGDTFEFSHAKTLVMYCNGVWCGQSPTAIRKLLAMGYPASKIKYYRGGMQSWASLGLTVIKP
jgi:rhodanese-related sulfurtransferase